MNGIGLGIDAGGTATRWALADAQGQRLAQGQVAGLHGCVNSATECAATAQTLNELVQQVRQHHLPGSVVACITGYDHASRTPDLFLDALTRHFPVSANNIVLSNDIGMTYLGAFAPGEGYLVYAGTGSMAAYLEPDGRLHRVGGRGVILDDEGGGFWIAKEALRRIWRQEDVTPQAWRDSPLACQLFAALGGSDWQHTRHFVYSSQRGDIGKLAIHVASCASADPLARDILQAAGMALARLAQVLLARHGPRPVMLAGGAAGLHPLIHTAMQQCLGLPVALHTPTVGAHQRAAQIAAQTDNPLREVLRRSGLGD